MNRDGHIFPIFKKFSEQIRVNVNSNFFVEIHNGLCSGCTDCITSCHMDANTINEDGISEVDLDYCIECGV